MDRNLSGEVALRVAPLVEGSRAVIIPVSFADGGKVVCKAMETFRPDAVLMLGFSRLRTKVSVERLAVNLIDACIDDNDGVRPEDVPVVDGGPIAIFSTLPVKRMVAGVRDAGIDACISNSAGTYVCNATFYSALTYARTMRNEPLVGFVHLPPMSPDDAVKAVKAAINAIV